MVGWQVDSSGRRVAKRTAGVRGVFWSLKNGDPFVEVISVGPRRAVERRIGGDFFQFVLNSEEKERIQE